MASVLQQRIRQAKPLIPSQEALLGLVVASAELRRRIDQACSATGLTQGQFNVLRILRGIYPAGHPRCEIAARMVERAPDVTRLIDRLEARGLVERTSSREDRRLSLTRITSEGLNVLEQTQPAIEALHSWLEDLYTEEECRTLTSLLERMYR